jgi:hypothetical protein
MDCNSINSFLVFVLESLKDVAEVSKVELRWSKWRADGLAKSIRPTPAGLRSIFMLPRVRNVLGGVDNGDTVGFF